MRGCGDSFAVDAPTLIAHNDIAPSNVCFDGDDVVGVFDWDLAGPSTTLLQLAFIAWNCVPLWRDIGPESAAARLRLIASSYGRCPAHDIPERSQGPLNDLIGRIPAIDVHLG